MFKYVVDLEETNLRFVILALQTKIGRRSLFCLIKKLSTNKCGKEISQKLGHPNSAFFIGPIFGKPRFCFTETIDFLVNLSISLQFSRKFCNFYVNLHSYAEISDNLNFG